MLEEGLLGDEGMDQDSIYKAAIQEIAKGSKAGGFMGGNIAGEEPNAGAEDEDLPPPEAGESKEDYIERLTGLGYTIEN
jgi:hypothetical protein